MATDYHVLEPFPLFVDSAGPSQPNYFSSKMSALSLLSSGSSTSSTLRSRISIPTKISHYVRLRYYQYEVTFGLYMMTPVEKYVLNTIIFGIMALLSYGLFLGLQPFLVRIICRLIWYITGTNEGVEQVCT